MAVPISNAPPEFRLGQGAFRAAPDPCNTAHEDGGVPTGKIEARFHAPSRHGDHLLLELTGQRISRSTFDFTIKTSCAGQPRMSYAATLVFIDAQGKSTPWTDDLRAALTPYINSEA